ncbi:MAG: TetR/AcrR family transcriptional regulator [Myxococcales bacterium]|nr:TetR/AcrR family transcriptional regulator [Myxococcales bacterium]
MTLNPSLPARGDRAARTRLRILDSAGQCFAASGFSKTTVEEIALRAGVSKALVYHRFRSKEEILEAVLEHTLDQWEEAVRTDDDSDSVLAGIRQMFHSALDWVRANPVVGALFSLEPMVVHSVGEETVRRRMDDFRAELVLKLEEGIESGELRRDVDPGLLADVVRLQYLALVEQVLDPRWLGEPDHALVDASLEVLFRGIAGSES